MPADGIPLAGVLAAKGLQAPGCVWFTCRDAEAPPGSTFLPFGQES
jgi:hypothetical protein